MEPACLDENRVLRFLAGGMSAEEVAAAEAHVEECALCRDLVHFASGEAAAGGPTFAAGELVAGRYRIERFIAQGGMGEVYAARDERLGEAVALKTVRARIADDPRGIERLKREVQLARKVTHPNVCRIFDVGFDASRGEEIVFLTMELLDGETLAARIRRAGKLAAGEMLPILRQLADALGAAHRAGVIHRDFKSDNVILVGDRAVVTDFGLARAHVARETAERALSVVGTPSYMAPEQLRGEAVTARSDIYALGVVLYEMATGELPHGRLVGVGGAWERAIRRCMSPDPAARYGSAEALIREVLPRRRRGWLALGALAGVASVGGAAALALASRGAAVTCPPPSASELFVDARADAASGNGSKQCPFRTITPALNAAVERGEKHKDIHVAAGTYDHALGERFPLMVRGDISLLGAGDEATFVVGTGRFDSLGTAGGYGEIYVTLVAGDYRAATEIAGMAIASGEKDPELGRFGVLCDRGNLGRIGSDASRPPNTLLRDVTVGPAYDVGVSVTMTAVAGGCNLRLLRGKLRGSYIGVTTAACGYDDVWPTMVALDVESSSFVAMRAAREPGGAGVIAGDCTARLSVKSSSFRDSDIGLLYINHDDKPSGGLVFEDNELSFLSHAGVWMLRAASLERLTNNSFVEISAGPAASPGKRGIALLLDGDVQTGHFPQVRLARGNVFSGNDVGIELRGSVPVRGVLDFGRADDPGGNRIRCNGTLDGASVAGHDLLVRASVEPSAELRFAGNTWDHAPPSTGAANGADVAAEGPLPRIDVSGARAAQNGCSSRIP